MLEAVLRILRIALLGQTSDVAGTKAALRDGGRGDDMNTCLASGIAFVSASSTDSRYQDYVPQDCSA